MLTRANGFSESSGQSDMRGNAFGDLELIMHGISRVIQIRGYLARARVDRGFGEAELAAGMRSNADLSVSRSRFNGSDTKCGGEYPYDEEIFLERELVNA